MQVEYETLFLQLRPRQANICKNGFLRPNPEVIRNGMSCSTYTKLQVMLGRRGHLCKTAKPALSCMGYCPTFHVTEALNLSMKRFNHVAVVQQKEHGNKREKIIKTAA